MRRRDSATSAYIAAIARSASASGAATVRAYPELQSHDELERLSSKKLGSYRPDVYASKRRVLVYGSSTFTLDWQATLSSIASQVAANVLSIYQDIHTVLLSKDT